MKKFNVDMALKSFYRLLPLAVILLGFTSASKAASTDLLDAPLANATITTVKPNIMFLLDDSGSMQWSYLPDTSFDRNYHKYIGYRSYQCNKLAYNPNVTYTPPYYADGTTYPNSSINAAFYDGFVGSATVNLNNDYAAWRSTNSSSPAIPSGYNSDCWATSGQCSVSNTSSSTIHNVLEPAYYFMYKGNKAGNLGDGTSQDQCTDYQYDTSASSGNKNWYKVIVSNNSGPNGADERQNFANWYSYYRTRILMMKTASTLAFKNLDNSYRIGFMTIHNTSFSSNSTASFLNLADFSSGAGNQKDLFYSKLAAIDPGSGTPLRKALADVGRLYGGKFTGITDPVQYSCQQNFVITATDGYWNGDAGYKLDGSTAVGDQDGATGVSCPSCDKGTYPSPNNGKTSNGLADVAYYYYSTDLRPSLSCNVATDPGACVKPSGTNQDVDDVAPWLHMTTFTLGLGVNGLLNYAEDYKSGASSDYNAIVAGTKAWPKAAADSATAIDDLWHAAVDGRGTYFSAQDPQALSSGLGKALASIQATVGAAAAAATSNLQPVAGDNFAYVANYRTVKWDGGLEAHTIDLSTGALSATPSWSAQSLLDGMVTTTTDSRTIYTGATSLTSFAASDLGTVDFTQFSQYASWTASQIANATAANLAKYLRGQSGFEDSSSNTVDKRLFRSREHILGDIVHSQPVYVKKPQLHYADTGFSTWAASNPIANRQAAVFVGANDGMLHAFNADTGAEMWSYIPPIILPNLWKLADNNFTSQHKFYVDGSPTAGDVYIGGSWKTILVGGLNKGGRGYYALDITDPSSPSALWNFTASNDNDLGYSYGTPIITKRPSDGKWVVLVTSGYNNIPEGALYSGATGHGILFVLDAQTGTVLSKIDTGEGSTGTPSGLGQINNWVSNTDVDNTALRAYGGDLLGNLWRFDLSNNTVIKLAQLGSGAAAQPVTTKPELGQINSNPVVFVGTGQYLGSSDLTSTQQQSVYAIKDSGTALGDVRTGGQLVQQTITALTANTRTASVNSVDWATKSGWYADFPATAAGSGSERVNVDPKLQLGVLTLATNVPTNTACSPSGYSWLYFFDFQTGGFVSTSTDNVVAQKISNSLAVGLNVIQIGTTVKTIVTTSDDKHPVFNNPTNPSPATSKRVSWRELIQDN